jgi:hypothetical protein
MGKDGKINLEFRIMVIENMDRLILHDRMGETPEAKARWFQTLTIAERAELFSSFTEMILEINPSIMEYKHAQPVEGRIRIISKT